MTRSEAGFVGDVFEMAVAVVFEEDVAPRTVVTKRSWAAVVVNIGKRRADADAAGQTDAGLLS